MKINKTSLGWFFYQRQIVSIMTRFIHIILFRSIMFINKEKGGNRYDIF